jgi:hypothetical protein
MVGKTIDAAALWVPVIDIAASWAVGVMPPHKKRGGGLRPKAEAWFGMTISLP